MKLICNKNFRMQKMML